MGKTILFRVGAIIGGVGLLLSACSGTKSTTGPDFAGAGTFGNAGSFAIGGASGSPGSLNCVPGAVRCDGPNVKLCNGTGTQETITQTCLSTQACSNGACAASACAPNTQFCKDNAVWKCDQNGAGTPGEKCATGLFCREESDSASCSAQACSPNQPVCDGNVATTCRADGSGPVSGGMDCDNGKRACYAGQCRDIACKDGQKMCQHGDVYVCSHNGTDLALVSGCHVDEVCDADLGSCRARVCEPGKVTCDGTRVQTCNAFGSAWLSGSVDCAADGKICALGGCKKQVCAASRSFCQDGNLYSCDSTGTTATLSQTCNPQSEHCQIYSSGSFGYCEKNVCHAGDTVCDNNTIKVCNADGSLPATGTTCSSTQYCENAQCKDLPCTPGNYACKGSDIYYCDFVAPYLYLTQQCGPDYACKTMSGQGATCVPLACTPSSTTCIGDKIGTCAMDGQSLSAVTTDCTASTSICTTDLKCAKSATDTIGVAENADVMQASNVFGDVIDVDSTRKLTELQMQLVLSGPRELRWIIYELSGQTFVAKIDKLVSNVSGTGFISSGALDFKLTAGKRYLLGVVISGGDAVDYLDTVPYGANVSFGTVTGRVVSYYPSTFDVWSVDPNYVSQMKVTTEAP
ncbi:MAG TPA: hypothetical protein VFK05_31860 [Polyangiaceae bacterium]|nr:hypothetical protein [Polyangiaceae bacterium]